MTARRRPKDARRLERWQNTPLTYSDEVYGSTAVANVTPGGAPAAGISRMFPWAPWSREDEERIRAMLPWARLLAAIFAVSLGVVVVVLCWNSLS